MNVKLKDLRAQLRQRSISLIQRFRQHQVGILTKKKKFNFILFYVFLGFTESR